MITAERLTDAVTGLPLIRLRLSGRDVFHVQDPTRTDAFGRADTVTVFEVLVTAGPPADDELIGTDTEHRRAVPLSQAPPGALTPRLLTALQRADTLATRPGRRRPRRSLPPMWTLTQHGESALVTLSLYDNHRLHLTPPPDAPGRTEITVTAARHLVPGTTATFLVTSTLITEAGAVFYTPDHVPVASWPAVTLPTLPPGQEPDQRLDASQDYLTRVIGTVIAQTMAALARDRRAQERYARLTGAAPDRFTTTTPTGARVTDNRGRKDT